MTKEQEKIYNLMQDQESRYIYEQRVEYNQTKDQKYIRNIICMNPECKELFQKVYDKKDRNLVIFGAGIRGKHCYDIFNDLDFKCYVDNFPKVKKKDNIPVLTLMECIDKYKKPVFLVCNKDYYQAIILQLLEQGVVQDDIIDFTSLNNELLKKQYFDLPVLGGMNIQGAFVDGGCYDGLNAMEYVRKWGKTPVIAWEPNPDNIKLIENNHAIQDIDFKLIKKAMWNKPEKVCFENCGTDSGINKNGGMWVEADTCDNVIYEKVAFIKMDLEGAEHNALLGCEKIIKKDYPILAISIYHKPEDLVELPELILQYHNKYRFYLRHYSLCASDTVLYAITD